jgi:hypothetical protein
MVIVAVFALLAVIALLGLALGSEDTRGSSTDPRDDPRIWWALARR